ncbi:MAG: VWA domain-containing protein [Magnetococcales bacterium]|nr:VWA domain-containing protein [Magnetococcales bacterium]
MIENFHWLRPWWLLAIPLLLPLWVLLRRHTGAGNDWHRVCDPHLLPALLRRVDAVRSNRRSPLLITFTVALTLLALAGPVWQKLPQPVYQKQTPLVMILDLSLSMEATDLKPSRLERARLKIADLLQKRREGTTALIVFSGEAFAVTPLTSDTETIRAQLQALSTELMPAPGSHPELGIALAQRMLAQAGYARGMALLITDGQLSASTREQTRQFYQQGHRLAVLAVGTAEGGPIPRPSGGFVQDAQGAIVIPRLDEAPLRILAQEGGGRYARLTTDESDLEHLLADEAAGPLDAPPQQTTLTADLWHEEGPWLLLLVIPLAALGFRRGVLAWWLVLAWTQSASALEWGSPWQRPDQQGAEQWAAADPNAAAQLFTDPAWKAAALYRAGRFEESLHALEPLDHADAWYNRGNALAQLNRLEEAVRAYDEALKRDPQHADARHNRELVQKQHQPPEPPPEKQSKPADSSDPADQKEDRKDGEKSASTAPKSDQDKKEEQEGKKGKEEKTPSEGAKSERNREKGEPEPAAKDTKNQLSKESQAAPDASPPAGTKSSPPVAAEAEERDEAKQAEEQWLRRIPDDPGGLLRRKFLYQYQRLGKSRPESEPW